LTRSRHEPGVHTVKRSSPGLNALPVDKYPRIRRGITAPASALPLPSTFRMRLRRNGGSVFAAETCESCRNQSHQLLVRSSMNKSYSRSVVTVDETDPRDPTANCDRCGARGTIARAVRHTDPPLVLRYCGPCWPAAQEELEVWQNEELKHWRETGRASNDARSASAPAPPPAPWSSTSRSWFDTRRFLALIALPTKGGPATTPSQLAAIAADIRAKAAEMDGPVPQDIEDFLSSHGPPAA